MLKKDYKAGLVKTEKGTYIIKLSEFYGEDFVGAENVEVTEDVLDYIIAQKRVEKRKEIENYRKLAAFGFDDVEAAERLGKYESSVEEKYFSQLEIDALYMAMAEIDEVSIRRFYLYYAAGMKLKDIASMDDVSIAAVHYNIKNTAEKLRMIMCKNANNPD